VDDYLSEKEQWEAVKAWVRDNGLWIVAGVAIASAGLGGWRWYQGHLDEVGARASVKYNDIIQAFDRADVSQAFVYMGELEREYPSSAYVDQARLAAARAYVESNQLDKAATELQAVAEQSRDSDLALIARLRLARVQIAQQKPDVALTTLSAVKPGAFASRYHEVQGDAYYAKGDKANALKEYIGAKAEDLGMGSGGNELDLKISDLSASLSATSAKPVTSNSGTAVPAATAAASK
jgi:predicted negative regulator of RcsB-dependent stress response